jgi:hypothetical protein
VPDAVERGALVHQLEDLPIDALQECRGTRGDVTAVPSIDDTGGPGEHHRCGLGSGHHPVDADILISYVEEHRTLALSDGLEAAVFTTWCYERHSVPGPNYLIQTGQAIGECRAFLILPRDWLGSSQIDREVVRALKTGTHFIRV